MKHYRRNAKLLLQRHQYLPHITNAVNLYTHKTKSTQHINILHYYSILYIKQTQTSISNITAAFFTLLNRSRENIDTQTSYHTMAKYNQLQSL